MLIYTRLAPIPTVLVTPGGRKREGMVDDFLGGSAGLIGGAVSPMFSGTAPLGQACNDKESTESERTFLPARVVSSRYLPLPYSLEVFASVHERWWLGICCPIPVL